MPKRSIILQLFGIGSSFTVGAFAFAGVHVSCGEVQPVCAQECPAGPQGERGPAGPQGPTQWTETADNLSFAGSVGLGTETPRYRLHVDGGKGYGQIGIFGETAADMRMIDSDAPADGKDVILRSQDGMTFLLSVKDDGSVQRVLLAADNLSGNVGIGTSTPQTRLVVTELPMTRPSSETAAGTLCITTGGSIWVDPSGSCD